MLLLSLIVAALVVYTIGRALLRRLGWPTDLASASRWGMTLLVLAVLFSGLPELTRAVRPRIGELPAIDLGDLLPALCVLGLAALGYVGWTRGQADRERETRVEERARLLPRRPGLPPAPAGHGPTGRPLFRPAQHEHHEGAPEGEDAP